MLPVRRNVGDAGHRFQTRLDHPAHHLRDVGLIELPFALVQFFFGAFLRRQTNVQHATGRGQRGQHRRCFHLRRQRHRGAGDAFRDHGADLHHVGAALEFEHDLRHALHRFRTQRLDVWDAIDGAFNRNRNQVLDRLARHAGRFRLNVDEGRRKFREHIERRTQRRQAAVDQEHDAGDYDDETQSARLPRSNATSIVLRHGSLEEVAAKQNRRPVRHQQIAVLQVAANHQAVLDARDEARSGGRIDVCRPSPPALKDKPAWPCRSNTIAE